MLPVRFPLVSACQSASISASAQQCIPIVQRGRCAINAAGFGWCLFGHHSCSCSWRAAPVNFALCRTGRHSGVGVLKFPGTVLPALLASHRRNHAGVVVVVVVAARQLCRVAAMLALHHCAEIVSVFTQYFCNLHFRLQDRASWVGGITRQSTRTAFSRRLFLR